MIRFCFVHAFICILFLSCSDNSGSDSPDPSGENDWDIVIASSAHQPGIGNSDGLPNGAPWQLPAGIELVDRPNKPFDPNLNLLHGSLNTFYADVNFINTLDDTVMVDMPSGLIFLYKHEGRTQNGILTSNVQIAVPPSNTDVIADTTTVYIGLGCLNYTKAFPWEENQQDDTQYYPIGKDMYTASVVSNDENINQLLDILDDYSGLRVTQHYNPQEMFDEDYETPEWRMIYALIQEALWKITDGPGLMRGERRELLEALEPYRF